MKHIEWGEEKPRIRRGALLLRPVDSRTKGNAEPNVRYPDLRNLQQRQM